MYKRQVHALVYGYGIWFGGPRTELQADVRQFVFFAQRERQSDVVGRTGVRVGMCDNWLGTPTRNVVGIVQIGQISGGVSALRLGVVARVTRAAAVIGYIAVSGRRERSASAGGFHRIAERGVHKVGYTPVSYTHLDVYKRQHYVGITK